MEKIAELESTEQQGEWNKNTCSNNTRYNMARGAPRQRQGEGEEKKKKKLNNKRGRSHCIYY